MMRKVTKGYLFLVPCSISTQLTISWICIGQILIQLMSSSGLQIGTSIFFIKFVHAMVAHSIDTNLNSPIWELLWSSKLHEHLKFLVWKIFISALPVRKSFATRFTIDTVLCPFCLDSIEDEIHLFFNCHFARALWFSSPWGIKWDAMIGLNNIFDYLFVIFYLGGKLLILLHEKDRFLLYLALLLEQVWFCRNNLIFRSTLPILNLILEGLQRC